jgi:transcriptional regulator of acetoin/glycerol metabolism
MMVITDADGWLLWRAGERKALDRGERDGHIEGACLTERSIGTSGVSLALATRHPVLVHGAEHYAPALHDLACAAAPVYDPRDGRLLAVLNLTAPPRVANLALLRHIDEIARQVQRQLAEPDM